MLTVVQSIFAGAPPPPTEVPMHLVLPNGLALVGTPAELATLVRALREEIRAQVRPGQPTGRITYAMPGQRPLQSSARAWLRLADWIEETIQPPRPPGGETCARFPAAAGTTAAWMAPAAVSGRTTRLVSATSGPLGPPSPGADPRAGGIDPADPCAPLTSVPQQYRVRVLIPDRQVADGWGPHPAHREEIEVWAGSLATASLFVVLDPRQPIAIEPGHLVAARWVWRAFQTPNTDRPWTHPYTCFLDAAQIAMIRLELDRQTELLI